LKFWDVVWGVEYADKCHCNVRKVHFILLPEECPVIVLTIVEKELLTVQQWALKEKKSRFH
jgi:hypothetical protein